MHSETQRYQVRDAAGECKPMEILSGVDYAQAEIFHTFLSPGSCRHRVLSPGSLQTQAIRPPKGGLAVLASFAEHCPCDEQYKHRGTDEP